MAGAEGLVKAHQFRQQGVGAAGELQFVVDVERFGVAAEGGEEPAGGLVELAAGAMQLAEPVGGRGLSARQHQGANQVAFGPFGLLVAEGHLAAQQPGMGIGISPVHQVEELLGEGGLALAL